MYIYLCNQEIFKGFVRMCCKKTIMMKPHIEVTNLICGARQVSFNNWNWRKAFYFHKLINCCGFYQKSSNVFLYFEINSNVLDVGTAFKFCWNETF